MTGQIQKEFDVPLNAPGGVTRVRIVREGKTVIDFLAQYEAFIDGEYRPIIRYDSRHGRPHCDILNWDGETVDKRWAPPGTTNNQALTDAIDEITVNQDRFLQDFLRRRP